MASKTRSERFAHSHGHNYHGAGLSAYRRQGEDVAQLKTHGRTNAIQRQEVADRLATITETATVERIDRHTYRVSFHVTHRIMPIEDITDGGQRP